MDFQSSVEFIAGILVVIIAGVLLGYRLGSKPSAEAPIDADRLETYTNIVSAMDGLRQGDKEHKQSFIMSYYRAAVFAPDEVVRALNGFLQASTRTEAEYDSTTQAAARDHAVLSMRKDMQDSLKTKTKLQPSDLYSIEINDAPTDSPQANQAS